MFIKEISKAWSGRRVSATEIYISRDGGLCYSNKQTPGTSLVVWWLRNSPPMKETQVWSLVSKISQTTGQLSPCATSTEPVLWSQRAGTTKPTCSNYWSLCAQSPQQKKPLQEAHTAKRKPKENNGDTAQALIN